MTTSRTPRTLDDAEADAFGRELDALRIETLAALGQADVDHIRRVIRLVRYSEAGGRALLHFGIGPITFAIGTTALAAAKILENMEVGHNVMHGQYDWTGDPDLSGQTYEWDTACTGDDWRHSHNFEHHMFTNVIGRDRDVGYRILRISAQQRWHPRYLAQPIYAALLALLFQWGIGVHDLHLDDAAAGRMTWRELGTRARPFLRKAAWQLGRDYIAFPALALWNAPRVLAGNLLANGLRNLWTFAVIFCGHFPEGVSLYDEHALEGESRGRWYLRQLNGSANIDGGAAMHLLTGHLSHQIEHHMFPDLPASRYPALAVRVREICERYGQSYNTGSFARQLGSVMKQIGRRALPA